MRFRTGVAAVAIAGVGVAAAVGYGVHDLLGDVSPLFRPDECSATVGGRTVTLDPEQAENAALITAVSISRGLPAHAATIALATAYQESKLYNLSSGDRDSAGLFQQRPSQGWGTQAQVTNPYYATNAFYDHLERIDGYQEMRVTEAAQEVQRSGFPEAYAAHEADARVLASALTGYSAHTFSCRLSDPSAPPRGRPGVVRREIGDLFGATPTVSGRRVEVPVGSRVRGWAVAQYLVAMADRFSIRSVSYDGRVWTVGADGWQDRAGAGRATVRVEVLG